MRAFKRGQVYLVNFNPSKGSEAGKIRPALLIQTDDLNDIAHHSTIVLPLTTAISDNAWPLRYRIKARDRLNKDSDIMLDQPRAVDNRRITSEKLTQLNEREILTIEEGMKIILG